MLFHIKLRAGVCMEVEVSGGDEVRKWGSEDESGESG